MRALTVRQPWAWAIIHGGKDVENRSWTNRYATGVIAIHAGVGLDSFDFLPRGARRPQPEELMHGAIIGVVEVSGVVRNHRSKWFEKGSLGWVLKNPRPLPRPIRCTGRLGLWKLPRNIELQIERQLD
jgi:hypothetical protein